jgi:hypothetical protein
MQFVQKIVILFINTNVAFQMRANNLASIRSRKVLVDILNKETGNKKQNIYMDEKNFNRQEYISELTKRNAQNPCHRCSNDNFSLIDGYSYFPIQDRLNGTKLGGPNVPAILVVCNKCGAVTPHAVGAFKSFEKEEKKESQNG